MVNDKDTLVALLEDQINGAVLLVNSGKTLAKFLVLLEGTPENLLSKYLNEQKKDVLFTVSRIRDEPDRIRGDNVPRSFKGYYNVKIWTIDKMGVDGDALRELAYAEVKRVFAAYPAQRVFSEQDYDRVLGKVKLYVSTFTVLKVTET